DGSALLEHGGNELARVVGVLDEQHADAVEGARGRLRRARRRPQAAGGVLPAEARAAARRQRDDERRAAPLALAGRVHGAAVQLDEVANGREAEAEPAVRARAGGFRLAKALEDVR